MVKSIEFVTKIDNLNRVVIPKNICDILLMKEGDCLEIFADKEQNAIIIKKYNENQ